MIRRTLVTAHRWLGVVSSVPVCLWFLSGIGMMYTTFPEVTERDTFARADPLDAAMVRRPAVDVLSNDVEDGPPVSSVRLQVIDGRPVYLVRRGGVETRIEANTGERVGPPDMDAIRRSAEHWSGRSAAEARLNAVTSVDQWTVQGALRTLRPLWKFSWPDGEQIYVSGVNGDVVQFTTRASRLSAYAGPIPHWLYFTPLRSRPALWTQFVDVLAVVASLTAVAGLAIGIRRGLRYRSLKKWHHGLGLVFGIATVTWTFSGWLSMDPVPALAQAEPSDSSVRVSRVLRRQLSRDALAAWDPARLLAQRTGDAIVAVELIVLDGQTASRVYTKAGDTHVVRADGSAWLLTPEALRAIVERELPSSASEARLQSEYDVHYLDRQGALPLPVLRVDVNDAQKTRLYVDPHSARLVGSYQRADWTYRWLYHGLHSLDLPLFYAHRPLWDLVMIVFMIGGAALSTTSILLAWRVVITRMT